MNIYIHVHRYIWENILKKHHQKKLDPYIFVQKSPTPTRKKKHRPPAARQQKHSLHHKAVRHPSADSLRRAARHHSLCPCHVTPEPSKTAWGEVEFLPFYHTKKGQSIFEGTNHPVNLVAWKNTPRKSLFFKVDFLENRLFSSSTSCLLWKNRWLAYLHILHSKKKTELLLAIPVMAAKNSSKSGIWSLACRKAEPQIVSRPKKHEDFQVRSQFRRLPGQLLPIFPIKHSVITYSHSDQNLFQPPWHLFSVWWLLIEIPGITR